MLRIRFSRGICSEETESFRIGHSGMSASEQRDVSSCGNDAERRCARGESTPSLRPSHDTVRRNAVDPDPKYIKAVAIAVPFIGCLFAYLIKLGEAGYFRIPSSYVAVGLKDALISGALNIVAALVGLSLFTYFKGLRTHRPKAEQASSRCSSKRLRVWCCSSCWRRFRYDYYAEFDTPFHAALLHRSTIG